MYRDLKGWRWWLWFGVTVTAIVLTLVAACGCSRKSVPAATVGDVRTVVLRDTVERVRLRVDSVHVTDSVVTLIKGDTVQTDRWHTRYRERVRVDTVERVRVLTEYRTRTEVRPVEVERARRWWETALLWCGGAGILLAASAVIYYTKFRR